MKTQDIRLNILKTIGDSERYGYEIHKKLADKGREVEIGRLYKVLKEMLTEGALGCRWQKNEKGPEKRVYKLTEKGRKELDEILLDAIDTIHTYYGEYLLNLPTKTSIFESFARIVAHDSKNHCNIAIYANRSSPMHERLFEALQNKITAWEVCAVHPKQINLDLKVKNTISLQGDYDSIPLREKYLDVLIVDGLPSSKESPKAAEEWHRVLKDDGKLVIIAPTALFSTFKDPLAMGDFIEKMEHQSLIHRENGSGEKLKESLEKLFPNVQKKQLLHMTLLVANKPMNPPMSLP